MLSRVADAIYWMSRYVERAENVARFVDVNLNLMLDMPDPASRQWEPLVVVAGDSEPFRARYGQATEENVRHFMTFDRENPNSIVSCLYKARENARSVREAISSEMWEQLNTAYLVARDADAPRRASSDPSDFYNSIKTASHLFSGLTDTTMSHNEGWHFARLGRLIERADKTSRILDVKYFILLPTPDYVGTPYDALQWMALLKSASAFEMYRKRYRLIAPDKVVEFLALDRDFPRSMRYCLMRGEESLRAITGSPVGTFTNAAEQRLGRLRADLDYSGVAEIIRRGLHEFLDDFQHELNSVGDAVFQTFFALRPVEAGT